ncbi:MAG: hypothetical protein Fur003_5550 [Candidatus Dojkabacteria bacterium]
MSENFYARKTEILQARWKKVQELTEVFNDSTGNDGLVAIAYLEKGLFAKSHVGHINFFRPGNANSIHVQGVVTDNRLVSTTPLLDYDAFVAGKAIRVILEESGLSEEYQAKTVRPTNELADRSVQFILLPAEYE